MTDYTTAKPADETSGMKNLASKMQGFQSSRFGKIVVAGALGLAAFTYTCGTRYVAPGEIAVKQVAMSPLGLFGKTGVQPKAYGPGLHVVIPSFETMHFLPSDIQVVNLNQRDIEDKFSTNTKPVLIQTSDGFHVTLDASIIYHIADPYKVVTTLGAGELYLTNGLLPKIEPTLKETFGKLEPEDFYNVSKRVPMQEKARDRFNELFSEKGLKIDQVLVRLPTFDHEVQTKFEQKKVQDQLVFTNRAEAAKTEVEAQLSQLVAEGTQAAEVKLQTGIAYRDKLSARAQSYVRSRHAEGDRLSAVAEADKTRMTNEAYQGPGSDLLVGLRMAKNLKGLEAIFIPVGGADGVNMLDINKVADRISGKGPQKP